MKPLVSNFILLMRTKQNTYEMHLKAFFRDSNQSLKCFLMMLSHEVLNGKHVFKNVIIIFQLSNLKKGNTAVCVRELDLGSKKI